MAKFPKPQQAFDDQGMADFLRHLDQLHLVAIHPKRSRDIRSFYSDDDVEGAVSWAHGLNYEGYGIYWTVNRVRTGFVGKPSKGDIVAARYVHVDVDPPKNDMVFAKAATIETLENLRYPPTMIVDSGNGLQAYWKLEGDSENRDAIETINRQIIHFFDADRACFNIDRLMRVPGAINFPTPTKEARGRKPVMASTVLENTGEVFDPSELSAFFPSVPEAQPVAERGAVSIGEYELLTADDLALTPFHPLRRALERPKGDDRSGYGQAAAHEAVRQGLSDAQIAGLLLNADNAASAHFIDQEDSLRAVRRAIGRARGVEEIEEGDIEQAPVMDFTALIERGAAKQERHGEVGVTPIAKESDKPSTLDWYGPLRGGMKEMVDLILAYAPSPRPELALGASLALFSTAMGRRYQTPSGLLSNLYIVGLSPSGKGKDLPVNAPAQVLMLAGETGQRMVGGSEVVSARGLMTAVESSPTLYIPLDEMGKLIQSMQDPRGHLKEAVTVLLKLYSQSQSIFKGAMYANNKERPTTVIHRPCLGFYGVSNPHAFWDKLNRSSISDGLLPRFILLPDRMADSPPPRRLRRAVYPDSLVNHVRDCINGAGSGYTTFPSGDGSAMAPSPFVVQYADDAADDFEYEMRLRQYNMTKTVDLDMQPFVNRIAENAIKMAMVKAVSENPEHPMLSVSDMEWGWAISERSVREFIEQAAGNISENEYEAKAKAVQAAVVASGAEGATMSHIGKKCGWISGPERAQILDDLVDRGVLGKVVVKPQTGRPSARFWVHELAPV